MAPTTTHTRMKLVLVGNGMAGIRTLEELIKAVSDLYDTRCSATSRIPTTTASCCRRCWPASRRWSRSCSKAATGAYPEQVDVPPADRADSDVERARAAMAAGQDPTLVVAAPAAGPAYEQHPYMNGGHFGTEHGATDCE